MDTTTITTTTSAATIRLLAFPIVRQLLPPVGERFSTERDYSLTDEFEAHWSAVLTMLDELRDDQPFTRLQLTATMQQLAAELHSCFHNQVANNFIVFERLLHAVATTKEDGSNDILHINVSSSDGQKLLQLKEDAYEVISRDDDVFNDSEVTATMYVVVAVQDGNYLGHIYAWQSPTKGV